MSADSLATSPRRTSDGLGRARLADRRAGRRRRRARRRGRAAPAHPRRVRSGRSGCASSSGWCSRPPGARGRAADHVLLSGPPGLGKTTLAMIIAAEMGAPAADHQRAGHPARRRPRGDPVRPQRRRRALPRRDPPDVAARRGDALPRDGGLPGRRHRRQGPRRHRDPARDPAVHPGRRHHPGRPAARARCATGSASPAHLEFYDADELEQHRPPLRRPARRRASRPPAPPRSPAARAARRGSPTGCCAGSATTPRSAPTASVTRDIAARRPRRSTRSTPSGSTGSTGPSSTPCAAASAAARSGSPPSRSRSARSARRSRRSPSRSWSATGFLARTPRGRVATPAAWDHLGLIAPPEEPIDRAGEATLFES